MTGTTASGEGDLDEKCTCYPRVSYSHLGQQAGLPTCKTSMATPLPQLVKIQDGTERHSADLESWRTNSALSLHTYKVAHPLRCSNIYLAVPLLVFGVHLLLNHVPFPFSAPFFHSFGIAPLPFLFCSWGIISLCSPSLRLSSQVFSSCARNRTLSVSTISKRRNSIQDCT